MNPTTQARAEVYSILYNPDSLYIAENHHLTALMNILAELEPVAWGTVVAELTKASMVQG